MSIDRPDLTIPSRIFFFWRQGLDQAPALVRDAAALWQALNPDWTFHCLDDAAARRVLCDFPYYYQLPDAALSDVLRIELLALYGGVWVDATTIPTAPLDDWLDRHAPFAAFEKPAPDRSVSSWFLAAPPGSPLISFWRSAVRRYWDRPRTPDPRGIAADPDPDVVASGPRPERDDFPYFWFHYLFNGLIRTNPVVDEIWARAQKFSAPRAHELQNLCQQEAPCDPRAAASVSPSTVHKLSVRAPYHAAAMSALIDTILPMGEPVYFTICSRNYLAYALTLRASLLSAVPDARFLIFLADEPVDTDAIEKGAAEKLGGAEIVALDAINLPDLDDMAMRYDVMEFNTAIKPFCFRYLFDREGARAAIYLDPDILVLAPLDDVTELLKRGAGTILTPHHNTPPPEDGHAPQRGEIEASGIFNLGFAAFTNTANARAFIDWWADQCARRCFNDPANGLFVDQKFVERAPDMIASAQILRAPGYNVAYWNLHERIVNQDADGRWTANGGPLRFFHFSGVAPGNASVFSKHQTRFSPETIGDAAALHQDYLHRLAAHHHAYWREVPYAFATDSAGRPIPRAIRRLYARARDDGAPVRPFEVDIEALNAPSGDVTQSDGPITRFMAEIWRMRPDLQAAFPLDSTRGRRGFIRWFLSHGPREAGANAALLAPVRAGGAGLRHDVARAVYKLAAPLIPATIRKKLF